MKTIEIKAVHMAIAALLLSMLTSFIAFSVGVVVGDNERMDIAAMRVHAEMKEGIRDGRTFYLHGSNIRIYPRRDMAVNASYREAQQ